MFLSHVSRASNKIHRLVALVKVSEAGEALKLKMEIQTKTSRVVHVVTFFSRKTRKGFFLPDGNLKDSLTCKMKAKLINIKKKHRTYYSQ